MNRTALLPRASWREVMFGAAPLVGSRLDASRPRGRYSPIEARILLGLDYEDAAALEAERLRARGVGGDVRAIASALVASLLAPRGRTEPRPFIVSARVDNVAAAEAVDAIVMPRVSHDEGRIICFVHPHALNLAVRDLALRDQLAAADLVLPDGVGLRVAARLLGTQLVHNVNGTDLLPLLCQAITAAGRALVLVGAAPGVAEKCATALRDAHPGLEIPIVSHGFLDEAASEQLALRVAQLDDPIVLVGMGTPRQEAWAFRYLRPYSNVTAVTVGGLFDFYSGNVPRAPTAWRELGIEWIWRLAQEPRRMWRRYVVGNPLFVARAMRQRFLSRSNALEITSGAP